MATDAEWHDLIVAAQVDSVAVVKADTFIEAWHTASRPVAMECDDGTTYVLKACQPANPGMPKVMAAEQVVARLGGIIHAPVPSVTLVDVEPDLIAAEPQMAHMSPGIAHASRRIPNCTDRLNIEAPGSDANGEAYARLAVLYGWVTADDHQIIRTRDSAASVYSVDHGHFFPGGPNWSAATLATPGAATPDQMLVNAGADAATVQGALADARQIPDEGIARVIGWVQPSWGVPIADLVALGKYLSDRRDTL